MSSPRDPWAALIALALVGCAGNATSTSDTQVPTGTDTTDVGTTDMPTPTTDTPGTTPTGPDPATVPLGDSCPLELKWGEVKIESYDDPSYSIIDGTVADGVVPVTILEEIGREGDCVLLRRNNPFCDPACAPDQTCDFGVCIPYPLGQDLGVMDITGLLDTVSMTPVIPGAKYFDTTIPNPPYEPGALVTLTTTGGVFAPITAYGVGFEQLTLTVDEITVSRGEPLTITWEAAPADSRSQIWARMNVDQHGVTPVLLTCETADDGDLTIPSSLIDLLLDQGVTGFPSAIVHRRTIDSVLVGEGCMEFRISSVRAPSLRVAGYTPCIVDAECVPPQTCNEAIGLCE